MAKQYWKSLNDLEINTDNLPTLPLVHNIDAEDLEDACEDGKLKPMTNCDFLEEKLLFLYYGIPAYVDIESINPCILVFEVDNDFINKVCWSPTDSGANKIFNDIEKSGIKGFKKINGTKFKKEYVLNKSLDKFYKEDSIYYIKRHIALFFNNNHDYYLGINDICCLKGKQHSQSIKSINRLFNAAKNETLFKFEELCPKHISVDIRLLTVEGHSNEAIPLNGEDERIRVKFCFVPENKKDEMQKYFNLNKEQVEFYNDEESHLKHPKEIVDEGKRRFKKYLESNKLIKKK